MKKINIANLLRDCPSGMELDCTTWENVTFEKVVSDLIYVKRNNKAPSFDSIVVLNQYGCCTSHKDEKCRIFPKGKNTWEGFHKPFEDGDILATNDGSFIAIIKKNGGKYYCCCHTNGNYFITDYSGWFDRFATEEEKEKLFQAIKDNGYHWNSITKTLEELPKFDDGDVVVAEDNESLQLFLLKHLNNTKNNNGYNGCCYFGWDFLNNRWFGKGNWGFDRLATEEEKAKLFQTVKDNGYRWNPETKTLEKLPKFKVGDRIKWIKTNNIYKIVKILSNCYIASYLGSDITILFDRQDEYELVSNKFDITSLKPFDKVLARDCDEDKWKIDFFSDCRDDGTYQCMTFTKNQCIPYKGNEHLRNTSDSCDDYFKTWKDG